MAVKSINIRTITKRLSHALILTALHCTALTAAGTANATDDAGRPVGQLPNGFVLTVRDATVINELLKSGGYAYMQGGTFVKNDDGLNRDKEFCFLTRTFPTFEVKKDDKIAMPFMQVTAMRITAVSGEGDASLGCVKPTAQGEWTLGLMRNVFGATMDINAAE